MAEYPADLEFDVVLKDGATARLRPVLPTDADALDRLFHRLSARAVYQRFFRAKTQLSPEELEYFTNVDYRMMDSGLNEPGTNVMVTVQAGF